MINLMMIDRLLAGGFTDSTSAIRYYSPINNGLMVYCFFPAGFYMKAFSHQYSANS
jgi:hypothetical protein